MSQEYNIYKRFIHKNTLAHQKQKNDPLSKFPLRACAYSNEIGAAISPINKAAGTLLWAPALLYIGADIYDKYKNEDTTYSPSTKRSVKQVVFQGLASVIMPTLAIKTGQKVGVKIAGTTDSLSVSDKKELIEFTMDYLNHSDYPRADNSEFCDGLVNSFKQKAQENKKSIEKKGVFSRIIGIFAESEAPEATMEKYLKNQNDKNPVITYLKEQANTAISIMNDEKAIKSDKYKQYYVKSLAQFEDTALARKNTVLKLLKDKNVAKSVVATISGFIALFLLIKPIDYFVENILMEKMINPLLDKIPAKNKQS